MKWLRLPVAILAVTLFSGAAEKPAKTKSKSAESNASLEGVWSVVSAEQAGQEVPRNIAKTMRFVFSNTKVTIRAVDRVVAETQYTADPTQRPATIRLTYDGKETLGIYRIEGNGLMICLSGSTKQWPSKFASEADSPKQMLFALERGDLGPIGRSFFVAPSAGAPLQKWTTLPKDMGVGSPDWSPDGKKIAFDAWRLARNEDHRTARIYITATDGTGIQDIALGAMPSWSPDGKMITFCQYGEQRGVWIMNADGSGKELIDAAGWGSDWSPRGDEIVYTVFSNGGNLCVVNPETDVRRILLKTERYNSVYWNLSWAPDGKQICFKGSRLDGTEEIAIVSSAGDTKGFKVLLSTKDSPEFTSIEPNIAWDGNPQQILVSMRGPDDKCQQLYSLDPDAKKPPQRFPGQDPKRDYSEMAWSHDGKMVVFTSRVPD